MSSRDFTNARVGPPASVAAVAVVIGHLFASVDASVQTQHFAALGDWAGLDAVLYEFQVVVGRIFGKEMLLHKRIDGFGELFRMLSYQEVGARAMLSRATAGLVSTMG